MSYLLSVNFVDDTAILDYITFYIFEIVNCLYFYQKQIKIFLI